MVALRKFVQGACYWLPFIIYLFIFTIPLSLLYLYWILVTVVLQPIFRKNLIGPVTALDYGFSGDDFLNVSRSANAFVHVIEGHIDRDLLHQRIFDTLSLHGKLSKVGIRYNYERLTSLYLSFWLGYPFWTKLKPTEFDIMKHINIVSNLPQTDEGIDIDVILTKWLVSPFGHQCPLWDILLIQDISKPNEKLKSIFGFRIHHILGDGYSMMDFLATLFDEDIEDQTTQKQKQRSKTISDSLKMFFWTPLLYFNFISNFVFHSDYFSTKKSKDEIILSRTTMKLSDLKLIRQTLSEKYNINVSFVTVLLYILGGAVRKILVNDIIEEPSTNPNILNDLTVTLAAPHTAPHPRHSFCNQWLHGVYKVPLTQNNLRMERMLKNSMWLSESNAFEINLQVTSIYPIFPRCVYSQILKSVTGTPLGMTNLPGPITPSRLCGRRILEKYALLGLQLKDGSLTLGFFSYNGQLTLSIVANREVFGSRILNEKLIKYFHDEIQEILHATKTQDESMV